MALIGTFVPTSNGFTGRIRTFLLDAEVTISILREPAGENPPDFLITLGKTGEGPHVGAARRRKRRREATLSPFELMIHHSAIQSSPAYFHQRNPQIYTISIGRA